jgi:uncharacterized membrane-anchored protein
MRRPIPRAALLVLVAVGLSHSVRAQDSARIKLARTIQWTRGPIMGVLGKEAEVSVPASCRFTDARGAATFMKLTENTASGREEGILLCEPADSAARPWFVVFSYDPSGYVKDDEGKTLDGDAILKTLQRGTEEDNRERKSRGWEAIYLDGWERAPFYDVRTHNLTWATRLHDESGGKSINHSVRLLGRGGVMHADLVVFPEQFAEAVPEFDKILTGYNFKTGRTYAEWRQGDKMAGYGLTALVAGGAGVAAVKSGLLAKLTKPVIAAIIALKKLIVVAIAGVAAWFKSLFNRKKREPQVSPK